MSNRVCGDCVACCMGALSFHDKTIDNEDIIVKDGIPCFKLDVNNGCTIYEQRGKICQGFVCNWLIDEGLPEWLKPSQSGFIIHGQPDSEYMYFSSSHGGKIDYKALTWALWWANKRKFDIKLNIPGLGTLEFENK